jgi:hypothetical protein
MDECRLEIRSTRGEASLALVPDGRDPSNYFLATLTSPHLNATTRVYAYQPTGMSLGKLFRSMASEWRGWSGEQGYDSLEGEFGLSCRHDGLGHVFIKVRLEDSHTKLWSVKAELMTEAGLLDGLAANAERFERQMSSAT